MSEHKHWCPRVKWKNSTRLKDVACICTGLTELRAQHDKGYDLEREDTVNLLAEVEFLRSENFALKEALKAAVGDGPPTSYYDGGSVADYCCCGLPDFGIHKSNCWWASARALLDGVTK